MADSGLSPDDFAAFDAAQRSHQANAALVGAQGTSPVVAGQALSTQHVTGVPADIGASSPDLITQLAKQDANAKAVAASPSLRDFLASAGPAHVAAAQDSLPQMAGIAGLAGALYGTAAKTFAPLSDIANAFGSSWQDFQRIAQQYPKVADVLKNPKAGVQGILDVGGMIGAPFAAITEPVSKGFTAAQTYAQAHPEIIDNPAARAELMQSAGQSPEQRLAANRQLVNLAAVFAGGPEAGAGAEGEAGAEAARAVPPASPPHVGPDGRWTTTAEGHVADAAGNPVVFNSAKEAGLWAHREGYANGTDQIFEPANGAEPGTFHAQEVGRTAPPVEGVPAIGVHPGADAARGVLAEADAAHAQSMQEALAEAPVHSTSPLTSQAFLDQVAPGTVSVDAEALVKLAAEGHYPFPEHTDALIAALKDGSDVEVPLSRYLTATAGQPYADVLNAASTFREGGVSVDAAKEAGAGPQSPLPSATVVPPKDLTAEETSRYQNLAESYTTATQEVFKAQYLAPLFKEAKALGLTEPQLSRFSDALENAAQTAAERAHDRAYKQILAERKPEFTALAADHSTKITADIESLPVIRAMRELSTKGYKLDKDLTANFFPEPASRLPKSVVKAKGNHPDLAADHLGYASGGQLVSELADLQSAISASGAKNLDGYVKLQADAAGRAAAAHELGYALTPESLHEAANEMVSHEAIESLLVDEMRTLGAKLGLPLDLPKMKAGAADAFSRLTVREAVNPRKIENSVWRNGRKAFGAMQKGQFARAFAYTQLQFQRRLMLMESFKFQKYAASQLKQFARFAKADTIKSMDQGYLNLIHDQLQQHGYDVPQTQLKYEYEQWAALQHTLGEQVLPYEPIQRGAPRDLRVEDFRDLANRVENIAHLGREARTATVQGKKVELAGLVQEAVENAQAVARRPVDTRAIAGPQPLSSFNATANSPEVMIDTLDDGNPNGVFNRVLMQGARRAAGADNTILRPEIEAVGRAVQEVSDADWDRWGKRIPDGHGLMDPAVPSREMALLHQDLIGIALNAGSEHGRWHLEEGGNGWTPEAWKGTLAAHMTPADWSFVRKIAGLLESAWPKIVEGELGLYGVVPEKAETDGYTLADGTSVPGHYFPLKRDDARASRIIGPPKVSLDELFNHYLNEASTPAGHTKKRTWAKYPVSLDWQRTLNTHLPAVSKRLSYGQYVLDANKFLRQPAIAQLVHDIHGPFAMREFESWMHRQVGYSATDPRLAGVSNMIARQLRLRTYAAQTGLKLGIGLEHLTSIAQTLAITGAGLPVRGYAHAVANFLAQGPGAMKAFVEESSPYMQARHASTSRELRDTLDDIRTGGKLLPFDTPVDKQLELAGRPLTWLNKLNATFYNAINHNLVAIPMWHEAYSEARAGEAKLLGKALPEMTHPEAVAYADKVIGKSHGSGLELDMSSFQSGGSNEWLKLTNMYNVFRGTIGHIAREGMWHARNARESSEFTNGLMQLLMATAGVTMIGKLITDQGPKNASAKELTLWALDCVLEGMAHTVNYGTNLYQVGTNFLSKKPLDFAVSPVESTVKYGLQGARDLTRLAHNATSAHKEHLSKRWIQDAGTFLAMALYLPLGQPSQTAQAMYDMYHGHVQQPVRALAFGPSHENPRR